MSAVILNGTLVAAEIRKELQSRAQQLKKNGRPASLAVIVAGDDPASQIYVARKQKACEELGIISQQHAYPKDVSQETLLEKISQLNDDAGIDGILVQMPLPKHLAAAHIIEAINPAKDVDCFHPTNIGMMMLGRGLLLPCTPLGIIELLKRSGIALASKECAVVGRSLIVGKPLAMMLLGEDATVTVCHSRTSDLARVCARADILISAVGKAGLITAGMVKPGAVIVDVGMNRLQGGKLVGDVEYGQVSAIASYITPVPGGVGPMTIAMLMRNVVTAAEQRRRS